MLELGLELQERRDDALILHVQLRARRPVSVANLVVGWVDAAGAELPGRVLVTLPGRVTGERVVPVRLRWWEACSDALVRCAAWLRGRKRPVVTTWRPPPPRSAGTWQEELAAILDEVEVEHDECAFQAFLDDLCGPDDAGDRDELEGVLRDLMHLDED